MNNISEANGLKIQFGKSNSCPTGFSEYIFNISFPISFSNKNYCITTAPIKNGSDFYVNGIVIDKQTNTSARIGIATITRQVQSAYYVNYIAIGY